MKILICLLALSFSVLTAQASGKTQWKTECYKVDDDVLREELIQNNLQWLHNHVAYEDDNCQTPYLRYQQVSTARISGHQLDLTHVETSYTALTDEVAEALNLIAWCEITDWKSQEKRIVTGKDCGDFKPRSEGEVTYTFFEIRAISATERIFNWGEASESHDGSTPTRRHIMGSPHPFYWSH